jgi:hypothetical protein
MKGWLFHLGIGERFDRLTASKLAGYAGVTAWKIAGGEMATI